MSYYPLLKFSFAEISLPSFEFEIVFKSFTADLFLQELFRNLLWSVGEMRCFSNTFRILDVLLIDKGHGSAMVRTGTEKLNSKANH